jgi:N-acyl homoserine lactone hydrolase
MKIHAFNTAVMDVKTNYYKAKGANRLMRLGSVLIDNDFRPVPVYSWAIEHPEGVIVIDTGLTSRVNDFNYFPLFQRPYWLTQYRFHVRPEDEIGAQLRQRGISNNDVRWVVITHAHFDHTSALYQFPHAEVVFSRKEWDDVQAFRSAHFAFPSKWPRSIKAHIIDYLPQPLGPFSESYPLTGDVWLVPTPGHTMGHQSVILQQGELTYFFAGDTSFDLPSLLNNWMDAPAYNAEVDRETRRKILDYAQDTHLIYLTTHDFETETRLNTRAPLVSQPQTLHNRLANPS